MHSARRGDEIFTFTSGTKTVGLADVLPEWSAADRIGFVCDEPLGVLGASLLVQAASTAFFDVRPERRGSEPQYPEIYVFHAGGPFGDHAFLDFWPARKEVFVEPDPFALLGAINDRAISRLAVPEHWLTGGDAQAVPDGAGGWSERSAWLERVVGGFGYSASGHVAQPDVTISAEAAVTGTDAEASLDVGAVLDSVEAMPVEDGVRKMSGPTTLIDYTGFIARARARENEVSEAARARVAERRTATIDAGIETQSFRRASRGELLGSLTRCASP